MKRIIATAFALILIFVISFDSSASIKVDGVEERYEWNNAEYINLISRADSNNVDFALIKCYFDSNGYDAYFMLYSTDRLSDNLNNCGFILTLDNGVEITVNPNDVIVDAEPSLYNVSAKINVDESDGTYCEIKVSFKKGLPDVVSGTVSYLDGTGNNSYYYPFSFVFKEHSDADVSVITTENTTKVKTTKPKTTTDPKTTKVVETEKNKTTSAKHKENKTVVYFYEKEVVVSQVYVSESSPITTNEVNTAVPSLTEQTQRDFHIADGLEIQKIICALGGVVLVGFAAWAGLSVKKKSGENSSSDSEKTEK